MAKVTYTVGVQVSGGPQLNIPRTVEVEAFDKIEIVVPPGTDKTVDLQPSAAAKIALLVIKSEPQDEKVTFIVKGATDSPELTLKEPHVFVNDAVTLLTVAEPKSIKIANKFAAGDASKKAAIEILVARRA